MRALVVGLGSIGRRHLGNIRSVEPDAEIAVLRHSRSDAPPPEGADSVLYSIEDAIAFRPDVAFVCGPTSKHVEQSIALADAGAHLFVEKPLATDVGGAEAIARAASRSGRSLIVGYNLHFLPSLLALKRELETGAIGRVMTARAEVGQYLPEWRPNVDYRETNSARAELGGGIEFELSHEIDYVGWLLGDAASVTAMFAKTSDLEIEGEDTAELLLRMRSGAIASIHLDMTQRAATRTCRIAGTDGTLLWDGIEGRLTRYRPGEGWTTVHDGDGDRNQMYVREAEHVFACARGHESPAVGAADGVRAVRIAAAARAASAEGRSIAL